ncbi:MAG: UDP-N-acetylmuramoyl-L-alanine--D-glutamate ligase [Nitrospiraceae bacterium]|nr:UDP-N-acetylmuramoyl-L-alanine--D-glutamate ligase [Nitrospiraceae bacterium]
MNLGGKNVTVVGLARSGVGAANLLTALGARVTVTDIKTEELLKDAVTRLAPSVKRVLGSHPAELFLSADLIVTSPGVPELGPISAARNRGIPVIGELELAWQVFQGEAGKRAKGTRQKEATVPFLAVTGSNGKSTTTTLVNLMMRRQGFRTVLGGNIGNALTEELMALAQGDTGFGIPEGALPDAVVAELSSFQLEAIDTFRPRIAAILNITPDHMDRYHSMTAYAGAKARIFENQGQGDSLVLNADDPGTGEVYDAGLRRREDTGPAVIFFSRRREVTGVYAKEGTVYSSLAGGNAVPLVSVGEIAMHGVHNLENAMAASAMALLAGCGPAAVAAVLREFTGLEHRLEFVRELDGVGYINDSKGTNVDAVLKSLEGFDRPVVLIAGGRDKSGDFTVLRDTVRRKVKALILIGEAAGKMGKALEGTTGIYTADSLAGAVERSRQLALRGDVVLLSPACTSFDMFRDFEDRGLQFKAAVRGLQE